MDNAVNPSRVHYFSKQYLRRQDFADEQSYQIALRRRHNISHHIWGIVLGLDIAIEEGALVIRPGVAIDGYGRELFLTTKFTISSDTFSNLGSNRLDVWLNYDSVANSPAPAGYLGCDPANPDTYYRTNEQPRVSLERAPVSRVKARQPKAVPRALTTAQVQLQTPDDPLVLWPIYLGRVTYQPDQDQYSIDATDRPYSGVAAEVIEHPANAARIEIGRISTTEEQRTIGSVTFTYKSVSGAKNTRAFAVFVPPNDLDPQSTNIQLQPRFEIDSNGENYLRGSSTVYGNVQLNGGAVQFKNPSTVDPAVARKNPSIYRVVDGSDDQLRIDLGSGSNNCFVVGLTNDDGTFRPSLRLEYNAPDATSDPQAVVTVYGDLVLNGLVQCPDIIFRSLSTEALNALIASFQAGVISASS
jgi:hypothetical protein